MMADEGLWLMQDARDFLAAVTILRNQTRAAGAGLISRQA